MKGLKAMISGVLKRDGFNVIVGDIVKHFDIGGRYISDIPKGLSDIQMQKPYNAISILTSGGVVEVALFKGDNIQKSLGNKNSVMNLMMSKGFIKRLQVISEAEGIKFTQMIFIYDMSIDVDSYFSKAIS